MKKIFMAFTFTFTAFSGMVANAQNRQSGVYLNQDDFEKNKLTYATNEVSGTNKIHFNEFFERPYITVKHNEEKIQIFKDDIFAYQKRGEIVHNWNFNSYTFLEKGPLWIYYKDVYASQGKGIRKERNYFYSTSGKGEILPLTVNNLKQSFPDNQIFHVLLDAQFRSNAELSWYDSFAKKFKVNDLLETASSVITKK